MGGTVGDDTVCINIMFVQNQECSFTIFQMWHSEYNMQFVYFEHCFAGEVVMSTNKNKNVFFLKDPLIATLIENSDISDFN